jgi:hypothetical protein
MQTKILLFFLLVAVSATLSAQEVSAGFRAGLNFSTLNADSEMDADGNELEEYELTTGFHVGGMVNVKFTDIFTLRGELLYTQKGVDYNYNGLSYWVFETQNNNPLFSTGERSTILSITNSYIEFPISGVARFDRIEISGGMSAGFLVSSRGSGELKYSGVARNGAQVDPFTIALDFNYFQERTDVNDVEMRTLGSRTVIIPKTLGAYYEVIEDDNERLFNTLDVAIFGGVAFYLNQGLFVGLRANYGLVDVTKTERDLSRLSLDEDDNYVRLDDNDRTLVLQASVGFSF